MKALISSILLIFTIVVGNHVHAKTITGKIIDEAKVPIAGVEVRNVTKKINVISNQSGAYSIDAVEGDELTFNYIGYVSQSIKVGKSNRIDVILLARVNQLDEVVVAGYGTVTRTVTTGSTVAAVNLFQGNVAGLNIGAAYSQQKHIRIRGVSPIRGAQQSESYNGIEENKFINPLNQPLSTFAADVDAASYGNVRRFIKSGQLPPLDAVRIEEMINYFQYSLDAPENGDPVNIKTELAQAPWNTRHQLLRISLKAKNVPTEKLPTSNFVFLVDISGSMMNANKLPLVKSSLKLLVDQLREVDKVAIVTYAGNANVALESVSGNQKMKIKDVIEDLKAGGSTAGGDGLKMAYKIARQNFVKNGNNRIVMATDGDFNVGASSDDDMEKLIAKERESGVHISILGYGMGNYKDSKLELLANKGHGNYAYIDNISEARKAIITEFGGTLFTVAKDVKIQVEFNPAVVQAYRLIGYENRLLAAEDFNNDNKLGGDMGVGHAVTAIYEVVPVGIKSEIISLVDDLKYQKKERKAVENNSAELATVKFRYKEPDGERSKLKQEVVPKIARNISAMSEDFQFAASVAEFGMLLRNSDFKQNADFDSLIERAKLAKGKDAEGYRAEFIRMAEDAKALIKSTAIVNN
ncbi:DUF3520 domain-containing protein [Sphingobacterium alkalisoli]|uniref:DUF3520 domain-containing protein n=1 Tax=Sphingobacterium alkalisoli TaxID=1874115 RepID=A0A4U0GPE4_9SPHI|nr:VWA domain-containing protein [Sphingobacterium alkalisoli]TJY60771.1 DUF3520 domain-containing protein [Sphingobacterium alkalisoli]GGH31841.1 hypothetical protein GCM10011418_44940 [Sphingobacterium alkalisoli]